MKVVLSELVKMFVVFSLLLAVGACSTEEDATGSLPSVDDPDDTDPGTPDEPTDDLSSSDFWINITSDTFDVIIDKKDQYGTNCSMSSSDPNGKIECVIDVMEYDLYFNDLEIQYNAPPGMCSYIRIWPSWYYNWPIGRGPTNIATEENAAGAEPFSSSCQAWHTDTGGLVNCSTHPETTDVTNANGPTCAYDYRGTGGPNCCLGSYVWDRNRDTDNDGTGDTLESTTVDWGGSYSACISPHLGSSWEHFGESGIPLASAQKVPLAEPLLDVLKLDANILTTNNFVSTWSNWYEIDSMAHNHDGFYETGAAAEVNVPYWVDPVDDLDGSNVFPGRAPWEFECIDAASEARYQIDLYIREWNTLLDFMAYKASEGVTYNPDVGGASGGTEGIDCDYDTSLGFGCNDKWDYEDFFETMGGAYGTTPTTNDADRETYFPRID